MIAEDDKAKEAYLGARGWVPVQRRIPYTVHWMPAWKAADRLEVLAGTSALPLDAAVARQLKHDAIGFVYLLESLDQERRPGTRKLVAGLIAQMVTEMVQEFWQDDKAREGLIKEMGEKFRQAIPNLFGDRSFRDAVEAIRMLWHMHGKASDDSKTEEKPN